jgi:hypothetical protein
VPDVSNWHQPYARCQSLSTLKGTSYLGVQIVAGVAGAPEAAGPLDAVGLGLQSGAAIFSEFRRDLPRQRQAVIAANSELRE